MLMSDLFLLSLAALILVVFAILGVVFYVAAHSAKTKPAADRKIVRLRADSLRNAFRQAVELVEGNIASRAERYNIPWIMVLNEGDDPRPLPIAQSGVASVLSAEAALPAATQGISWHFFDRGIVVDIKAAYLGSPDEEGDEKPWDEFLSLCHTYRPQRPFDSVVITVPAAMLLADNTDAQLELTRHAKLAHRRLWLAQNRFAMRFAVYVVVTGCEALTGFAAFARALPDILRASMLGWSSPYDLSMTYQSDWVATAMSSIERVVSDTSAELFTLGIDHLDAREFLLLPARIDAIRPQLQRYVDELLRPSAYHEPFFIRGIYLTGDSSEFARGASALTPAGVLDAADDPYSRGEEPSFGGDDAGDDAPTAVALFDSDTWPHEARERDGELPVSDLILQPAFLRDLFDKKIFLEYGLTRPSRSQRLTRPVLHRALRWGGVALLGGWSIGLIVATVQLHERNSTLVVALGDLRRDAQERDAAEQERRQLPPDWYRRKALGLISLNDRLNIGSAWAVFMPGSWNIFDGLDERVHERFEREFGEVAVAALEREMLARVAQLSGVARDPVTGQLIVGADCTAPQIVSGDAPTTDSIAVENLSAMRALQRYSGSVDQLDAALQAMQRLQQPSPDNADALRLAVRYAFGVELQGSVAGSLPYFYRDARGGGAYASDATGGINLPVVQQALRCTFDKGAQQLDDAMFTGNPLLLAEKSVTGHLSNLSAGNANTSDFTQLTDNLRAIVNGIGTEQDLLGAGKSGWMRQAQFTPGATYDNTFARAAQNRLLGPELADRLRQRSANGFQAFRSVLDQHFGGADSAIVWVDKDARYAVSPARIALHDGLTTLLGQPFMVAPHDLTLPSLPGGSVVIWDHGSLDRALAFADVRKHFLAEGLNTLPEAARPSIEQALDVQFSRLIMDQVAGAATVSVSQGEPDDAAFQDAYARLVKVRAAFVEMNAAGQADDLGGFVSSDAMAHLGLVNDELARSELYSTRPSAMSASLRSPVLSAFGLTDVAALGSYLDQQGTRASALGKQAAVYLAALAPEDAASPLAQRWRAIDLDLDRYQLKNPNSSLLLLEQFVQAVASDPDAGDCISRFPSRPSVSGDGDYFSALHAQLYDTLLARCAQGYVDQLRQQWESFARAFNEGIAGHPPFAGPMRNISTRGGDLTPADFGDLGQTLKRYESVSHIFQRARNGAGARVLGTTMEVRQFLDNFDQVDALLAPLYAASDGGPSGLDIGVEFRANRIAEIGANQVIDWTLKIGDQSISLSDAPRSLHWDYGVPLSLVLRLAKDSPLVATGDPQQRAYSTDGRTLTWQFNDPWALVSFISQQRVTDPSTRANAAQLLRFDFPLGVANAGDAALLPRQSYGQVFLRLTLTAAGKKVPLSWPDTLPTQAPDWNAL